MVIKLKSEDELKVMREAGRIVANTLNGAREMIRPGLNVMEIEKYVRQEFQKAGALETFLNYAPGNKQPYPSNICISINEQLVHGIPKNRVLQEGDLVTLDLGLDAKGDLPVTDVAVGVLVMAAIVDIVLARNVLAGRNWARLWLMSVCVASITFAFVADVRGTGTVTVLHLPIVGSSILVLLALSSHRARDFATGQRG